MWKRVDTVQMLHIVNMLQILHMVEMLQMFHMVTLLQILHMVDSSRWWQIKFVTELCRPMDASLVKWRGVWSRDRAPTC